VFDHRQAIDDGPVYPRLNKGCGLRCLRNEHLNDSWEYKKVMKYGTQREEEEFVGGGGGAWCRPHPTLPIWDGPLAHGPCHTKASHEFYHNFKICKS
jgi:hypothetical protein